MKICFMGAGSTVFAKNVLGDCILTKSLGNFDIALYDIDEVRLNESYNVINNLNKKYNGMATIAKYLNRKEALRGSDFIINAIQVGGYKPCTVVDFKIPRKYGLKQTIGDTLGIGGIMRALRTIPVLEEFAKDIEEVCPNAYFLNYTNPMAMLTGYLLKYTKVKAVGLCHSVQACVPELLKKLQMNDIKAEDTKYEIYGINHQAWLLSLKDKDGKDIYPDVKARSVAQNRSYSAKRDAVRFKMMNTFGYYITESSEHNAEYLPWFIKRFNPLGILKYCVPLNEYPRRCRNQIKNWKKTSAKLAKGESLEHTRSHEYGSQIIEAIVTNTPYTFSGSVLNTDGLIPNLPKESCVEVPIVVDGSGMKPQQCNALPDQCAFINISNITPQLLTLKAERSKNLSDLIMAVATDPHTQAVLSLDAIEKMVKELCDVHYELGYMPKYE